MTTPFFPPALAAVRSGRSIGFQGKKPDPTPEMPPQDVARQTQQNLAQFKQNRNGYNRDYPGGGLQANGTPETVMLQCSPLHQAQSKVDDAKDKVKDALNPLEYARYDANPFPLFGILISSLIGGGLGIGSYCTAQPPTSPAPTEQVSEATATPVSNTSLYLLEASLAFFALATLPTGIPALLHMPNLLRAKKALKALKKDTLCITPPPTNVEQQLTQILNQRIQRTAKTLSDRLNHLAKSDPQLASLYTELLGKPVQPETVTDLYQYMSYLYYRGGLATNPLQQGKQNQLPTISEYDHAQTTYCLMTAALESGKLLECLDKRPVVQKSSATATMQQIAPTFIQQLKTLQTTLKREFALHQELVIKQVELAQFQQRIQEALLSAKIALTPRTQEITDLETLLASIADQQTQLQKALASQAEPTSQPSENANDLTVSSLEQAQRLEALKDRHMRLAAEIGARLDLPNPYQVETL